MFRKAKVEELVGKTLVKISPFTDVKGANVLTFRTTDGDTYELYHEQNCCESVSIEEVIGDLGDIIGSPILRADEVVNPPESLNIPDPEEASDSTTWTFYRFGTIKGFVTIRWFGSSNGYYSEEVDFAQVDGVNEVDNDPGDDGYDD